MRPLVRLGSAVGVLALVIAASACARKEEEPEGGTGALTAAQVKVALVPGGAHPYFQPWKDAGAKAKVDFAFGDVTFNETAGWDQTKQNDVLTSLAARGYNAFGIFSVAPESINSTFENPKKQGFKVGSLASCPIGDRNLADFCLSTDVQEAAYKAAKARSARTAQARAAW